MTTTLVPYLTFNGDCREAMEFYQAVLGGELTMQTFGESGMPAPDEAKDRIIHADLKNEALSFMASDGPPDQTVKMGENVHMSLGGSDETKLTGYFDRLAAGGSVDMALEKQFWGDAFGMLTDKFGVHWMVSIYAEPQE